MSLADLIEHVRFRRYLDATIDDELAAPFVYRVRAHMAACAMCTKDEATTRVMKHRLAKLRSRWPILPPQNQ